MSELSFLNVTAGANHTLYYTAPDGMVWQANGNDVNCTKAVCPVELSVYGYVPSLPFSIVVIVLYALCMVAQLLLGLKYRVWGFMSAMLVGCILEIIGYAGRIMMWHNPWNDSGFIMQIVLITIAPVFFSAAIYVMIYQIANYVSPSCARFPPKLFYWIFIPCDILSLILQAVGGGMSASSESGSTAGVDIALAGLSIQVATLVLFIVAWADYMWLSRTVWRYSKLPTRFWNFLGWLFAATILILIRCCYRVYELSEGYSRTSEALRDQPLFIALEGAMVIAAAWCLVVAHPGWVFYSKKGARGPAQDGVNAEPKVGV